MRTINGGISTGCSGFVSQFKGPWDGFLSFVLPSSSIGQVYTAFDSDRAVHTRDNFELRFRRYWRYLVLFHKLKCETGHPTCAIWSDSGLNLSFSLCLSLFFSRSLSLCPYSLPLSLYLSLSVSFSLCLCLSLSLSLLCDTIQDDHQTELSWAKSFMQNYPHFVWNLPRWEQSWGQHEITRVECSEAFFVRRS